MGVGERVGTGDRMGAWTEVEAGEGWNVTIGGVDFGGRFSRTV